MSSAEYYRAEARRFLQRAEEVSDPDMGLAEHGDGIRRAGEDFGKATKAERFLTAERKEATCSSKKEATCSSRKEATCSSIHLMTTLGVLRCRSRRRIIRFRSPIPTRMMSRSMRTKTRTKT